MTLNITQVSQLYVSIFGRAAEGAGNNYWQNNIHSTSMGVVAEFFIESDEAKAYFGSDLNDNQAFIEHIYQNTLGMTYTQDPLGVDYWVTQLENGWTKAAVTVSIIDAVQISQNAGPSQDQFNNKVETSNYAAENLPESNDLSIFSNFIQGVTHDNTTVKAAFTTIDEVRDTYSPKILPHDNITFPSDLHVTWVDTDITSTPHSAIGQIVVTVNGQTQIGTGFLISPEHVLTNAHVLVDDTGKLDSSAKVSFTPGLNGDEDAAKSYDGQNAWVERNIDSDLYATWPDNDLGIIKLNQPIGDTLGYLKLASEINLDLSGVRVQSAGYSAGNIEQDDPATPGQDYYQWEVTGTVDQYLFDNSVLELSSSMNVTAGASGSPIYYSQDGDNYFTGVLAGSLQREMAAAAMDQDSYNWVLGVLQQDGYYLDHNMV